jgi:hypothetical protein
MGAVKEPVLTKTAWHLGETKLALWGDESENIFQLKPEK